MKSTHLPTPQPRPSPPRPHGPEPERPREDDESRKTWQPPVFDDEDATPARPRPVRPPGREG